MQSGLCNCKPKFSLLGPPRSGASKAQPPRGLVGHCTSGRPLNPPPPLLLQLLRWRREAGEGGLPPRAALCRGWHLWGDYLEFWRLHCTVLAQVYTYLFIYSVHRGWVLPVEGAAPCTDLCPRRQKPSRHHH